MLSEYLRASRPGLTSNPARLRHASLTSTTSECAATVSRSPAATTGPVPSARKSAGGGAPVSTTRRHGRRVGDGGTTNVTGSIQAFIAT